MTDRIKLVLDAIDTLNAEDPNHDLVQGKPVPREHLYSKRMTERLAEFMPEAGELLQIAVHAQHIQRWKSKRADYPLGKAGYYRWRTDLGKMHAETTAGVMRSHGYDEDQVERTQHLLMKRGLKTDVEVQALEDVACLVFLEHYFLPFAEKYEEQKVIDIVQKTWRKMSSGGQAAALQLPHTDQALNMLKKALDL